MKTTKHSNAPSSLSIGLLAVEDLLQQSTEPIDIKTNTEYLISILELLSLECLKPVFTICFQILQDSNSTQAHKEAIKSYITSISVKFQTSSKFKYEVVSFFESQSHLPINILQILPLSSSIILTILSSFVTKFQKITKIFLGSKILSKIQNTQDESYKDIDESIFFEVLQLNLDNFSLKNLPFKMKQLYFSNYEQIVKPVDVQFEQTQNIYPTLFEVVIESDSRSLTTTAQLSRLFNFYDQFDSKHAASFLLALSSSQCQFRNYFSRLEETQKGRILDLFREALLERKVNLNSISGSLDLPQVKSLDSEGCELLFVLLQGLLKDRPINGQPFIIEWENKSLQLQFLTYLASFNVSGFVFNNCTITNLKGFEPNLEIPNQCWLYADYLNILIKLYAYFPNDVNQILTQASEKYSPVILLTYSQMKITPPEIMKKSAVLFLSTILQNHNTAVLNTLWSVNPQFFQNLFTSYYYTHPGKLSLIIDSLKDHLNDILECNDINFVLDLAFQASLGGLIDLSNFFSTLPKRFTTSAYDTLLNFVKTMVLDSTISSPVLLSKPLNTLFSYFWDVFDSLSLETKLQVNSVYSICDSSIPSIDEFHFAEKLPPVTILDAKNPGAEYFNKYVSKALSVEKYVQIFHQLRGSSQPLYHTMVLDLIEKIANNIDHYDSEVVKCIGELIGHMIHENLLNEEQMKRVFETFVQGFRTDSQMTEFAMAALDICAIKLVKYPEYAFALLKQPLLRTSKLYARIRKLSSNLSAPINLSKKTTLTLHPLLMRFDKLPTPLPRIQQLLTDPTNIATIQPTNEHIDWIALHLVSTIQDHPKLLNQLLPALLKNPQFVRIVIQAAIFESIQLITSPDFSTIDGKFTRRRLSILGKLLGNLTFKMNKVIQGRFLDLKQLLLYAFSQGKLLGVVPFVAEMMCVASPSFLPPNPYTSGLLQVLASIVRTDLLKLSIKNDIFRILDYFNVSPCQFFLDDLIPDVRQGNFDFLAPPFALNYVLSQADIDRVTNFDEGVFKSLAAQNLYIPEPSSPNQSKDQMKQSLTTAIFNFLKQEGTNLARVAQTTASSIISKDFSQCNNPELRKEAAAILTKQLSSGFTLVAVFQKEHRNLSHAVQHDYKNGDVDWINECITVNSPWISQMLREIVHLRAYKHVQKVIDQIEESRRTQNPRYLENTQQSRNYPPLPFGSNEQGLAVEQRQIYEDLAELPLNPAEITMQEASDKGIRTPTIDQFEKFFSQMNKLIETQFHQQQSAGMSQDILLDDSSSFSGMIAKCPQINQNYNEFLSIIKIMMKWMVKANHPINDRIYETIIKQLVSSVPKSYAIKAQPYVVNCLRSWIPSISLLVTMIQTELITTQQLDNFFFNSLNKQPFNYRLSVFAIRFLGTTLVNGNTIKPADMMASLKLAVSTPFSLLENVSKSQQDDLLQKLSNLKAVLDDLDIPYNVLSPESKLQLQSTFKPFEGIEKSDVVIELYEKWVNTLNDEKTDDDTLFSLTKRCCELGRDFFIVFINQGSSQILHKFLLTIQEIDLMDKNWPLIASAFVYLLEGNSNVLHINQKQYFDSLFTLLTTMSTDFQLCFKLADLFHSIRPLKIPSFTFNWIQLVSERHFVLQMLSHIEGWDRMATILSDFVAALVYASDIHVKGVMDNFYNSLLRFILVIAHDFQDFLSLFAPEFVSLIPPSFSQLHNIILSVAPSGTKFQPFNKKQVLKTPGIDEFKPLAQPSKGLIEKLHFNDILNFKPSSNPNEPNPTDRYMNEFIDTLESSLSYAVISSFVVYATNVTMPTVTAAQIMNQNFKLLPLNIVLIELIKRLKPNAQYLVFNAILDMVRYPCRSTLFYIHFVLLLFHDPPSDSNEIKSDELMFRVFLERATPVPPHPWGFRILVSQILIDNQAKLLEKPFIKGNQQIIQFIKKREESFQ